MADIRTMLRTLERAGPAARARVLDGLSSADVRALDEEWSWQAHGGQREPGGDWRTWLLLAGRGFGKTRAGAEWVLARAREDGETRIALVAGSKDEAARVMVEGESGLLAAARTGEALGWRRGAGELRFPSGAVAQCYGGGDPEALRGPQHGFAWADELAKWRHGAECWHNLQLGLRLGPRPRALVTTTPRAGGLLRALMADAGTAVTRGRTADNRHLPPAFVAAVTRAYAGTRRGRQELDGEMMDEADGALWTRDMLEACRADAVTPESAGDLARVAVGVDPPAAAHGDACGIVACGLRADGVALVLEDASAAGLSPEGWARRVARTAERWNADRVVAEANNGGEMVEAVLRGAAPGLPVQPVHASRGKGARAEPVAAAFERGLVRLCGRFPALEDELAAITAGGHTGAGSPDRADAMVWALTALVVRRAPGPRVRAV